MQRVDALAHPILSQEDAESAEEIVSSGLISAPSAPSCRMLGWWPGHTGKAEVWDSNTMEDYGTMDASTGSGGALQLDFPDIVSRKPGGLKGVMS